MFGREDQEKLLKKIVTSPIFMMCVALAMIYVALDTRALLYFRSVECTAEITAVNIRHDLEGKIYYNIEYAFEAEGKKYSGFSNYGFDKPDVGRKIKINYLAGKPAVNNYGYKWVHFAKSALALLVACVYLYGFFNVMGVLPKTS